MREYFPRTVFQLLLVVLVFASGALAASATYSWSCSPESAAIANWVEAIGAVAAILAAIWVPFEIDRRAREREDDQAALVGRSLALMTRPLLVEYLIRLIKTKERWTVCDQESMAEVDSMNYPRWDIVFRINDGMLGDLPKLGRIGGCVQDLLHRSPGWNQNLIAAVREGEEFFRMRAYDETGQSIGFSVEAWKSPLDKDEKVELELIKISGKQAIDKAHTAVSRVLRELDGLLNRDLHRRR